MAKEREPPRNAEKFLPEQSGGVNNAALQSHLYPIHLLSNISFLIQKGGETQLSNLAYAYLACNGRIYNKVAALTR